MSALPAPAELTRRPALVRRQELLRRALWAVLVLAIAFVFVWVLFVAPTTGKLATSFGSAVHDPKDFFVTVLNSVTLAGLYFVVASGFTLIFGLMRVVNMAHGALFLLGGYIALKIQRQEVGQGGAFGLTSDQVNLTHWILPAIAATGIIAGAGLLMQQLFLRWNQGQELRQALITIAIAIILSDQMLAHFGGVGEDIHRTGRHFVAPVKIGCRAHDPQDRGMIALQFAHDLFRCRRLLVLLEKTHQRQPQPQRFHGVARDGCLLFERCLLGCRRADLSGIVCHPGQR